MLPRAINQNDATRLFNKDKMLTNDELIQLADWYPNGELMQRANRSIVNRGGKSEEKTHGAAGSELNAALLKRARIGKHDDGEMRVCFRIRRAKSFKIKYGEDSEEYRRTWTAKQIAEANALAKKHGFGVLNPELASDRIKFSTTVSDNIKNFPFDNLEASDRTYEMYETWHNLIREGESKLTPDDLVHMYRTHSQLDELKLAISGMPKGDDRAIRILWLVTIFGWVLQSDGLTTDDEGQDRSNLMQNLLRVTADYTKLAKTLELIPLTGEGGLVYSVFYGHHMLSHLYPLRSYHLHLGLFIREFLSDKNEERVAMQEFIDQKDMEGATLPESADSLDSFMATVTKAALATWLKSDPTWNHREPLFSSIEIAAKMRFDPPIYPDEDASGWDFSTLSSEGEKDQGDD
ncbi:hypothetical protein CBER1_08007 [Cercospora berteroae]|uniref:Uncharacterized protein n=1 Tax=Cercospora berteroae TaxID=357750 RepID=A0A2S6CKZ2_9PEZI|nr:hypothetical protein CBER1_08007 [Cercospora berteroae]